MLRRNLLTRCHINSTFIWVQHFECISPSHLQELNDVTYAISGEFAKWYCLSYSLRKVWKCFIACHKNLNNGSQIFMACTIGQYTDKINAKLQTYAGWQKKVRSSPQLFLPLFPPCVCGKALFSPHFVEFMRKTSLCEVATFLILFRSFSEWAVRNSRAKLSFAFFYSTGVQ